MDGMGAVAAGLAIGISITAPVGPMAMLCINRTLQRGIAAGLSTGAGATTAQLAYAAAALLGAGQVKPWLDRHELVLHGVTAVLMLAVGWRCLQRRTLAAGRVGGGSILRSYASALAFNLANPMLVVLLVGAVGVLIGDGATPVGGVGAILCGICLASLSWWAGLSAVTATLRTRLSVAGLRVANAAVAAAMFWLGAVHLAHLARC